LASPLLVALDAPPQEVDALVDMADARLGLRQAQAHGGQHRCDLVLELLGVRLGAGHHDDEVVRVADQPPGGLPALTPIVALGGGPHCLPGPSGMLVQHRQGQVAEQR
jgi:hypothetical protein